MLILPKIEQQIKNEHTLRDHPELSLLLKAFLVDLLNHKPEDPVKFSVSFFTRPTTVLKKNVQLVQKAN
jgi:hypothetical protein